MPTSLYQALQAEEEDLKAEEQAIIAASPKGFSDEQRERLMAIDERLGAIAADVTRIDAARQRTRTEPSLPADAAAAAAMAGVTGETAEAPKPFRSFGEQLAAVARAARNQGVHPGLGALNDWYARNAAAAGANELVGSEGGFLVQTDFADELLTLVHNTGVLASRTDRRPVGPNANGTKFNSIDETSRVDGSRWGGVRAYWTAEAASLTSSKPKYSQTELTLQKLTGLYYATDEELGDVTNLEANVDVAFSEEFGFKIDDAIVRGTGAGMPLGWLNAAGTVSIAKETGQAAATILGENVKKMYARMLASSMGDAVWYINQDCWPQIFELHQVIGTGGVPLFVPAGGLSDAPFGTLLGRPIQPIEQAETVGTVGDITFADLSQYLMIEKGGIARASSIHVQFLTDETAFRWVLRTNGRPKREAALTPFKGAASLSAFITLATRS